MNAREPDSAEARLSELLHAWEPNPALPPHFARQVWRRIGARTREESPSPWTPQAWAAWFAALVRRPRMAFACLACAVIAGAGTGAWHGKETSSALSEDLRGRYIASIDPFAGHPR